MKHSTLSSSPNSGNTFVSGIPQRTIKFRALKDDMSNCNWMYGQLVYDAIGQPRITEVDKSGKGLTFHTCLKNTECQFTGEYTDNGVEIYDGDIFKPFSKGILFYAVRFEKGSFVLYHNYGYWGTLARFSEVTEKMKVERIIIGNVCQNPELLG